MASPLCPRAAQGTACGLRKPWPIDHTPGRGIRTDAESAVPRATINPGGSPADAVSQRASPVPTLGLTDPLAVSPTLKYKKWCPNPAWLAQTLNPSHPVPFHCSIPSPAPTLPLVPTKRLSPLAPKEVQFHSGIHARLPRKGPAVPPLLPSSKPCALFLASLPPHFLPLR